MPTSPPPVACDHTFLHLETVRYTESGGGYNTHFVRVDRFYCTRCLHAEERRREGWERDTPEWYRGEKGPEFA